MAVELIKVPDLGGAESVEVIEVSVAVGDTIDIEDSIVVLETDKASMDVPSPVSGQVVSITVKEGDSLSEGDVLMEVEATGAVSSSASTPDEDQDEDQDEEQKETAETKPESAVEAADKGNLSGAADSPKKDMPIIVPDIGTEEAVAIIEVSVAQGDQVSEGETLLVLETDKATVELPAPVDGELSELTVKEGDKTKTGDQVGIIASDQPGGQQGRSPDNAIQQLDSIEAPAVDQSEPEEAQDMSSSVSRDKHVKLPDDEGAAAVYAGPAVRMMARKLGVDLLEVTGSGPRNRIVKEDIERFVKQGLASVQTGASGRAGIPSVPSTDFSKFGETETIPLTKIQKVTSANMTRSWLNVPHVTQFDEADITDMEDFRESLKAEGEKRGTKITPLVFMLRACANALKLHPEFNRSISADGEAFIQKHFINIGVAVDTPRGLLVPVVRDVDHKGLWELAAEVSTLAAKAREGKLSPAEMQGGCFTISSLGAIGGTGFTPIVSAPEVAILGVSKSQIKPVWNGGEFLPRLMVPLALSYDHRAINGADGGRFMTTLVALLSDIRRFSL